MIDCQATIDSRDGCTRLSADGSASVALEFLYRGMTWFVCMMPAVRCPAIADRPLARLVACRKMKFFAVKDVDGRWIDYEAAVTGDMQLVPAGQACDALAEDYERMLVGGMLLNDQGFEEIEKCCADLGVRINGS